MSNYCDQHWAVIVCDLRTGRELKTLSPVSMSWQTNWSSPGQGTLTLSTRDTLVKDVWPHLRSVYIQRIAGGDASPFKPVTEFAGIVEQFSAQEGGTTQVGMKSIEQYLWYRHLDDRTTFNDVQQTQIAKKLVEAARIQGIPLYAVAAPSKYLRDRTYERWEKKNIGEALTQLHELVNGVEWEVQHARSDQGTWSTTMIFRDHVGVTRNLVLQSDREANAYSLEVDAAEHATHVDGIGESEADETRPIYTAEDASRIYPRFDTAQAWEGVVVMKTLSEHVRGYLAQHQEPVATPTLTVPGLEPAPSLIRNGDVITVDVDYGAASYEGQGRVTSTSWNVGADAPPTRTFELQPLTRASESVLDQRPGPWCP